MLSDIISVGQIMELQALHRKPLEEGEEEQERVVEDRGRVYRSKVFDVLSEDQLEIMMPIENSKVITLMVDEEYDMWFYAGNMLYQCYGRILDRYKSNNIYIAVVELTSSLKKHQRREFYRLDCAMKMASRRLDPAELRLAEQGRVSSLPRQPLAQGTVVDISGGGMRFITNDKYGKNSMIYCTYYLEKKGEKKQYHMVGKVLSVRELGDRPGNYEHRVQYVNLEREAREDIIKYIFEEERKQRQKARN